jgi:hypothetical protein
LPLTAGVNRSRILPSIHLGPGPVTSVRALNRILSCSEFSQMLSCSQVQKQGGWSAARRKSAQQESSADAILGSTSLVVLRRKRVVLPSTLKAEWWPLRALASLADLRTSCRRQLIINLPAGEPKGRSCNSGSTALFGDSDPSGDVPDNGIVGRDRIRRREHGGQGPDCVPKFYYRVLCVKGKALIVIFIFQMVLHIKCNTTALN